VYQIVNKNDLKYTIGVSPQGILLGEYLQQEGFLINKTFISRDLTHDEQDEVEKKLIGELQMDLLKAMLTGTNNEKTRISANIVKGLTGAYIDKPKIFS
jgi:hypothetical protein